MGYRFMMPLYEKNKKGLRQWMTQAFNFIVLVLLLRVFLSHV
jgi:succinate dehydrogenase hydrophobic anchor subunit